MENNEKYRVSCVVDNMQPEIKAMQEKDIRKRLLCDLEEVICSGEMVTIKVTREEHQEMHDFYKRPGASRVTYTANLGAVREMPIMINAELFRKSTGRNHRKKDRAMETVADAIRATILVICETLENMARITQETIERIKTMPEEDFLRFLDNPELSEGAKAMAWQIRRNGQYGLHTSNAGNIGESGEEGNTAPGTADNTGLHGIRTDNTAGNEYSN